MISPENPENYENSNSGRNQQLGKDWNVGEQNREIKTIRLRGAYQLKGKHNEE